MENIYINDDMKQLKFSLHDINTLPTQYNYYQDNLNYERYHNLNPYNDEQLSNINIIQNIAIDPNISTNKIYLKDLLKDIEDHLKEYNDNVYDFLNIYKRYKCVHKNTKKISYFRIYFIKKFYYEHMNIDNKYNKYDMIIKLVKYKNMNNPKNITLCGINYYNNDKYIDTLIYHISMRKLLNINDLSYNHFNILKNYKYIIKHSKDFKTNLHSCFYFNYGDNIIFGLNPIDETNLNIKVEPCTDKKFIAYNIYTFKINDFTYNFNNVKKTVLKDLLLAVNKFQFRPDNVEEYIKKYKMEEFYEMMVYNYT